MTLFLCALFYLTKHRRYVLKVFKVDFGPFKDVQNMATMFGQITKRAKEQYHVSVTERYEHHINQHYIKFWSIWWGAAGVKSNIISAYS